MLKYIFKRLLTFIPTLLIISLLAFLIGLGAPGDPVEQLLRSADSEGGTSEKMAAADEERQKLREKLGLDKPVFYFAVNPMSVSDTMYRIGDRTHRTNLRKLTLRTGNWPKVDAYYQALLAAKIASDGVNADTIVARNTTVEIVRARTDQGTEVADTVTTIKYPIEEVSEARNRSSIEIVSLLQANTDESIISRFDTLTSLYGKKEYLAAPAAAFAKAKAAYEDLMGNTSRAKSMIPTFKWYGFANQYHIWLFGNRPYAETKKTLAADKEKLETEFSKEVTVTEDTYAQVRLKVKANKQQIPKALMKSLTVLEIDRGKGKQSFTYDRLKNAGGTFGFEYDDKISVSAEAPLSLALTIPEEARQYVSFDFKLDAKATPDYQPSKVRGGLVRGDFGLAYKDGQPISSKIAYRIKWSLLLSFFGIVIAYLISIPIGIYSAYRKDGWFDRGSSVFLFILYSLPNFFVGTLLLVGFANPDSMVWFPASGIQDPATFDPDNMSMLEIFRHRLPYFVLPIITYTYSSLAFLSRIMRVGMVEVFGQDYIRTSRAKGLSEGKVVLKHALRNSLIPIITVFANIFPAAIGGSIVIEKIFGIPGMGAWILESVVNQDYPVIITVFTILGFVTMIGYLISDILYAMVDPRISYK